MRLPASSHKVLAAVVGLALLGGGNAACGADGAQIQTASAAATSADVHDGGRDLEESRAVSDVIASRLRPDGTPAIYWDQAAVRSAAADRRPFTLREFPNPSGQAVELRLVPFTVAGPDSRFVVGRRGLPDRVVDFDTTSVSLFRGTVAGRPGSHVYFALSENQSLGFIDLGPGAGRYEISSIDQHGVSLGRSQAVVFRHEAVASLPPGIPRCGVGPDGPDLPATLGTPDAIPGHMTERSPADGSAPSAGLKHLELAVETDYEYFALFGDESAALAYLIALYGAVSDIYIRDVNVHVELVFARIWTDPDDLFNSSNPLPEFANHWEDNMGKVQRDAAQLFSGRRNYPFGGQAYVNALCSFAYSVVGYAVGFFPDPSRPSPFNFDVPVTAHELGHNSGTLHTHDYGLDTCHDPSTTPRRGPIMSYCGQTWSGMSANTDNYFHTVVRQHINSHVASSACIAADCNMNNVADAQDVSTGASPDLNGNGIPDECEDCNNNGILDPIDIAGASDDDNGNGIPDECEPDCNGNGVPDDKDVLDTTSTDLYGNGIPDDCEADCDANGMSDYTQIQLNMTLDLDRDAVLDSCQDCDGDGVTDLQALDGAHDLWIASGLADTVLRRFHATTGTLMETSTAVPSAQVAEGQDVIISPDERVFVASAADDRVIEFDRHGNYIGDFVASGAGGLAYPTGMALLPDGDLLVASRDTHEVLRFDGTTGAPLGAFVVAGAGGLSQPFGQTFGPNGNLFVTSTTNEVLEFDGTTGAPLGKLVDAAANGTLDQPRGLTFKADGNLLVCSFGTDEVLEFNGATGVPLGKWAQVGTATAITQDSPWGIRVGPNGHVFVSRTGTEFSSTPSRGGPPQSHLTDARMFEYDVCTGLFRSTLIGGNDHFLFFATGFDFLPGWSQDCNQNRLPDDCDIDSGASLDLNLNGTPDECEVDCNGNGVTPDLLDLIPFGTSLDVDCNFIPDECQVGPPALPAWPHYARKNRYVSFATANPAAAVAFEVSMSASAEFPGSTGVLGWVGEPDVNAVSRVVDTPYYDDSWPAVVHVGDCEIVPVSTYEIRATKNGVIFSDPFEVGTILQPVSRFFGDTVGLGTGDLPPLAGFTPPNQVVNVTDVSAYLLTAQGDSTPSAHVTWVDLHGSGPGVPPNYIPNVSDLQRILFGLEGQHYADPPDHLDPADCP